MRALIVIEVEVPDGQRPGTPYARVRWVVESLRRFAGQLRRVQRVESVAVHPVGAELSLGPPLFSIPQLALGIAASPPGDKDR